MIIAVGGACVLCNKSKQIILRGWGEPQLKSARVAQAGANSSET